MILRHIISALFLTYACLLSTSGAIAQEACMFGVDCPDSPSLTCDGTEQCGTATGDNATRINALLSRYSVPFSYNLPAEPVTTREVTVTSAAQFNSAARTAGTRIVVGASFSGNISISADDIDVVMDNALTINGNLGMDTGSRISRVRWTGGNVGAGNAQSWRPVSDVLFDDVVFFGRIDLDSRPTLGSTQRVAFINSTITTVGSSSGDDIDFTFESVSRPGVSRHSDIILANTLVLNGNNSPTRMGWSERTVFVESYFYTDDGATPAGVTGFRFSSGSRQSFIAGRAAKPTVIVERQHLNYILGGLGASYSIEDVVYDNIEYYSLGTLFGLQTDGGTPIPNTGEVSNVTFFSTVSPGSSLSISPYSDEGGIGTSQAWDGLESSMRSQAAYGAQR